MNMSDKSGSGNGRWPSGISFLMYCAGISLVLLVGYVIFSGKGFDFSANDKGVAFKSALNQGGAPMDSEKSEEFKKKFNAVTRLPDPMSEPDSEDPMPEPSPHPSPASSPPKRQLAPPTPPVQPLEDVFNGIWFGNGSSYTFEQRGMNVSLIEMTNGIATSYAQGTANGSRATLTATNWTGITFPVELQSEGNRIKLTAMGTVFYLDRN